MIRRLALLVLIRAVRCDAGVVLRRDGRLIAEGN